MSEKKSIIVQGKTYYVKLEAHKDKRCFMDDACFKFYLTRLKSCLDAYQIELHCYALLPNKILLLMSPSTPTGISSMMRVVGRAYANYFNQRYDLKESLWQGKYKSNLLKNDSFILDCYKYIETAPVRESLASSPEKYQWSSYYINAFGGHGRALAMHDQYKIFGAESLNRFKHYRDFVAQTYMITELCLTQHKMLYGCPLDSKVPKSTFPFNNWNPSFGSTKSEKPKEGESSK